MGTALVERKKKKIKSEKPWGIILFKRNIKTFSQLKKLTTDIRNCLRDPFYPILIDEEGGKVSRFSNLINSKKYSHRIFWDLYEKNKINGYKLIYEYYLNSNLFMFLKKQELI